MPTSRQARPLNPYLGAPKRMQSTSSDRWIARGNAWVGLGLTAAAVVSDTSHDIAVMDADQEREHEGGALESTSPHGHFVKTCMSQSIGGSPVSVDECHGTKASLMRSLEESD